MPNLFASLVLYSYPLLVLVLFNRLDRPQALIWSIMAGYLFLPERAGIDLPLLPALDKTLIPSLSAAVMCLAMPERRGGSRRAGVRVTAKGRMPRAVWGDRLADVCMLVLFAVPVAIYVTNTDPVIAGQRDIPGLRPYDIFSMMLNTGVMLLPFVLSRRYLNTPEAQLSLLRAFVAAGLVYAVLILIEVRLSPQLNKWIYGFYSHSFAQHIRAGGFRPMVFIQHGLRVGIFMAMATLAALTLWRVARAVGTMPRNQGSTAPSRLWSSGTYVGVFLWLLVVLVLSKTIGALAITLLLIPVIGVLGTRLQTMVAAGLTLLILLYPMLRAADVVPVESIVAAAENVSAERAQSLQFRLENEDILLDRARDKPVFGWGDWGRSRVYEPVTGKDISVTDGFWIIAFGSSGWVGYLARFGLLALPVLTLVQRHSANPIVTTGLSFILVANLIDLIPNSGLTPLTWMVAGTLMARVRMAAVEPVVAPDEDRAHAGTRYTRFATHRSRGGSMSAI
jgi:hypothetical protein